MFKGWFVGDFEPSVLRSKDFEVAIKAYKSGDSEDAHVHKIATELTVIISGEVEMNGQLFGAGSILLLEPGEKAAFAAIKDAVTVVVKTPSVSNDKYSV